MTQGGTIHVVADCADYVERNTAHSPDSSAHRLRSIGKALFALRLAANIRVSRSAD